MALGIVEPKNAGNNQSYTAGSSALYDEAARGQAVKHASGKDSSLILVPTPSDSPNDPLNWPLWKKDLTFFVICFNVLLGAVLSPVLSTVGGLVVPEMRISFNQFALLSGWPLLTSGCAAWIAQVTGQVWGKRPTYIVATILLLATSIWNSRLTTYKSFVACRLVEGFGNGPYESIIMASIGDMYFVHERGKRVMFYNMMTLSTVAFSPIIGGYISQTHGWRAQFYIISGFLAVGLLMLIFACPEHTYMRDHEPRLSTSDEDTVNAEKQDTTNAVAEISNNSSSETRKSWIQELKPFNGRFSKDNILILALKPFVCMLYPTVFWAFLIGGCWSAWNTGTAITLAQVFSVPPHRFSPSQLGYVFTFPFVGTLLAYVLGTIMADSTSKWAARHNGGVFEPEYRMYMLIPSLLVGIPGLFAFGNYSAGHNIKWVVVSVTYGLLAFGNVFASAAAYSYILDAHNDLRMEVSVAFVMMRNFFWFGSSYFLPTWIERAGVAKVFDAAGGIQAGITVLSIFAYCYGKVIRRFIQRYSPVKMLGWDT